MIRMIMLMLVLMLSANASSADLRDIAPMIEARYPGYVCTIFRLAAFHMAKDRDEGKSKDILLIMMEINEGPGRRGHRLYLQSVVEQIWKLPELTPTQLADVAEGMCYEYEFETDNFIDFKEYYDNTNR